jgi:hypothetical protein
LSVFVLEMIDNQRKKSFHQAIVLLWGPKTAGRVVALARPHVAGRKSAYFCRLKP